MLPAAGAHPIPRSTDRLEPAGAATDPRWEGLPMARSARRRDRRPMARLVRSERPATAGAARGLRAAGTELGRSTDTAVGATRLPGDVDRLGLLSAMQAAYPRAGGAVLSGARQLATVLGELAEGIEAAYDDFATADGREQG